MTKLHLAQSPPLEPSSNRANWDNPPVRIRIQDFIKNEKQLSIYIQAIRRMYATDHNDTASHFQIGGLVGRPFTTYGTIENAAANVDSYWRGHCPYTSTLFPTWNRLHILRYENILCGHAVKIAGEYGTEAEDWKNAAATLRIPFWDFAMDAVPPDEVIAQEFISIITPADVKEPDGWTRTLVPNPFWGYNFHPAELEFFTGPFSDWTKTVRHPTTVGLGAQDDVLSLKSALMTSAQQTQEDVFRLLTAVDTWSRFSSQAAVGVASQANSLERIHDNLHGLLGKGGHLSHPQYAGHDPLFYLIHTNLDRLMTIARTLKLNKRYVDTGTSDVGTWSLPSGSPLDVYTVLTPFACRDNPPSYWNSVIACSTHCLGYTYPEFPSLSEEEERPDLSYHKLRTHIHKLYHCDSFLPTRNLEDQRECILWALNLRCKKFALGRSFSVHLFLGRPHGGEANTWTSNSPNFVGRHYFGVNHDIPEVPHKVSQGEVECVFYLNGTLRMMASSQMSFPYLPKLILPLLQGSFTPFWRVHEIDGSPLSPEDESRLGLHATLLSTKPYGSSLDIPMAWTFQPNYQTGDITLSKVDIGVVF